MLVADGPYISDLLLNSAEKLQVPMLATDFLLGKQPSQQLHTRTSDEMVEYWKNNPQSLVYTNSENALNWITQNLTFTDLPRQINQLKDKHAFRQWLWKLFPSYQFHKLPLQDLLQLPADAAQYPLVIKPAVGFFSLGIYIVHNPAEMEAAKKALATELEHIKGMYPESVMNAGDFLLEEWIDGDEYAIDAYFTKKGQPVVLNIYKHLFANEKDVSDRAYYTSPEIIADKLEPVMQLLQSMADSLNMKGVPIHLEVRDSKRHGLIPIEANPLRFAGWCMSDMTNLSWGINPYTYFFHQQAPDWPALMEQFKGRQFNAYIADIPATTPLKRIQSVDYEAITRHFSKLIELRPTDYNRYPLLAFIFTETATGDFREHETMLQTDFTRFLRMKSDE